MEKVKAEKKLGKFLSASASPTKRSLGSKSPKISSIKILEKGFN